MKILEFLSSLFLCQEVPEPINYFVTHWSRDVWSQMSYSFVKTGGSGEAYDILAEDVQGKVFFAGEVTLLLLSFSGNYSVRKEKKDVH